MEDKMEIIIIVLILVDIGARVALFLIKKRKIKEKDEIIQEYTIETQKNKYNPVGHKIKIEENDI